MYCWAKFMDPDFSESHRRFIEEHDDVLTEGYTSGPHWICPRCVEERGLHVEGE